MSNYRDELAAAHRRIEALEAVVGARPERNVAGTLVVVTLGLLLLMGLAGMGAVLWMRARTPHTPSAALSVTTAPPLPAVRLAQWYPEMGHAPLVTDVDADGLEDVVGLFWDPSNKTKPLHVVALAHDTLRPLWRAGPFPGQWGSQYIHLVKVGPFLVLVDSQAQVHVLALSTGQVQKEFASKGSVTSVCAAKDHADRIWLRHGWSGPAELAMLDGTIVRTSGKDASDTKDGEVACARAPREDVPFCALATKERPCLSYANVPGKTPFDPYLTYEGDDWFLTKGTSKLAKDAEPSERPAPYAVGGDRKTRKAVWEGALSAPDDRLHVGTDRDVIDDGKLFLAYQLVSGPMRLVGRDIKTGALAWARELPDTQEASILTSLSASQERVYAVVDATLYVYEAASGRRTGILHTVALEP